jgi:hypothetical protein
VLQLMVDVASGSVVTKMECVMGEIDGDCDEFRVHVNEPVVELEAAVIVTKNKAPKEGLIAEAVNPELPHEIANEEDDT